MNLTPAIELIKLSDHNYYMIEILVEESIVEGFQMVERTILDWKSGANRFSGIGESFWGLLWKGELIGIGGLNIDPYVDNVCTGRIRHLYIRKQFRRQGFAKLLMSEIVKEARQYFTKLRLYTDNSEAALFYQFLGFRPINDLKVSHQLIF